MLDKNMGVFPRYKRGEFAEGPSFHHYSNKCFVVSPEHLEELLQEMQHGVELARPDQPCVVDVRAYTRSGEKKFERLSEVAAHGNGSEDRLQSIGISVQPQDSSMVAMVRFQDYSPGWSVSVIVEGGDEQASLGLFGKLRDGVESTYQWYSFLLSTRFWISMVVIAVIVSVSLRLGAPLLQKLEILPPPVEKTDTGPGADAAADQASAVPDQGGGSQPFTMLEVGTIVLLGLFFALVVLPYVFPRGVFLIGEEVKRAALVSKLRWGLLAVVVLLPVAAVMTKKFL